MQRVVVQADLRNKEIGSRMMTFCEEVARANNCDLIYCHARESALKFYFKNGYASEGNYLMRTEFLT